MVVCVECGLPADKPWDVVSATRRSSGLAPRACVRVYARVCCVLVPPNLSIHTYIHPTASLSEVSVSGGVIVLNQSIKGPHKATHGQGEATSQHHHRGQQTLRHEVPQQSEDNGDKQRERPRIRTERIPHRVQGSQKVL